MTHHGAGCHHPCANSATYQSCSKRCRWAMLSPPCASRRHADACWVRSGRVVETGSVSRFSMRRRILIPKRYWRPSLSLARCVRPLPPRRFPLISAAGFNRPYESQIERIRWWKASLFSVFGAGDATSLRSGSLTALRVSSAAENISFDFARVNVVAVASPAAENRRPDARAAAVSVESGRGDILTASALTHAVCG